MHQLSKKLTEMKNIVSKGIITYRYCSQVLERDALETILSNIFVEIKWMMLKFVDDT